MQADITTEATIASVANKVTYAGGATALIGGFSISEIAALGGLLIAAAGFVVQLYYKRKADRRDAEFHAARLQELREP